MIKTISHLFLILLLPVVCSSFQKTREGIQLTISGLRNNKGHVLVSLYQEGSGYPDHPEKAFRKAKLVIKENNASVNFSNLPAASYAIAILHDENNDQAMEKNFLGIPKEGYGFSNNVMGKFGPPAYSKASFRHLANGLTTLTIEARYP